MKARCDSPGATVFHHYGAKGIAYAREWAVFENFLRDMGERPAGTSLDRKDGTRGYCKDNCRWATRKEQNSNRANTRFIECDGRLLHVADWAKALGITVAALYGRIKRHGEQKAIRMGPRGKPWSAVRPKNHCQEGTSCID